MNSKTIAPDFSDLPGIPPSVFRRLARLSEEKLLGFLWSMAEANDVASLATFVEVIQAHGSPGALYDAAANQREREASYPAVFAHALRSTSADACNPAPWTQEQNDLFDHLLVVVRAHPERERFLRDLATFGAAGVREKRFFDALAKEVGPLQHTILYEPSAGRAVGLLEHAVLSGNAAAATALAPQFTAEQIASVLDQICRVEQKRNRPLVDAILRMPNEHIGQVLDAFVGKASTLLMGRAQLALVDGYLATCLLRESTWARDTLEVLCGKNGLDPILSPLLPAIQAEAKALDPRGCDAVSRPHFSTSSVILAMGNGIAAQCAPLLELMAPLMIACVDPQNKRSTLFDMGTLVVQSYQPQHDPAWSLADFRECFHLMQRLGYDPNDGKGNWASLFHALAQAPIQRTHRQKFVALLDLGLDPWKKDESNQTAMDLVPEEVGKEWERIAISHQARNSAHALLDEMEKAPKVPMRA